MRPAPREDDRGLLPGCGTFDDDPDNNGVGNTPVTNGSVVHVRAATTDTVGN
jgi:hypothetical protein